MQIEAPSKSKSLQGITDLTLLVPIKQGLLDTLDTRTYESRLRMLFKTLNGMRVAAREHSATHPFSDTVDRINAIHSFRLAIVQPEAKVLLAVTFDSAWEPYIRVVWRDLGPLLDVIFCNCQGYVTAYGHGYQVYADYIRSVQAPTEFFYTASALTVGDLQYLRQAERLTRDDPPSAATDLEAVRLVADDPETVAKRALIANVSEALRQGITALSALYRLTDMYTPGTGDGDILLRAAHQLLKELHDIDTVKEFPPATKSRPAHPIRKRFGPQLGWFEGGRGKQNPPAAAAAAAAVNAGNVQGGILSSYEATHGALLLISFDDAAAVGKFLAYVQPRITTEATPGKLESVYTNLAFTLEGLRVAGLDAAELAAFPQELREGMEARAGVLGDVRSNHPLNWALPEGNWSGAAGASAPLPRVRMSMVHAVVQLAVQTQTAVAGDHEIVANRHHPLYDEVERLAVHSGGRVLSVQAMRRYVAQGENAPRDHFGFFDGTSQPVIGDTLAGKGWSNEVPLGELLLGYPNASRDLCAADTLRRDGTYLVLRKLRQDVARLDDVLAIGSAATAISPDDLKAKMMGRTVATGEALANPGQLPASDFTYDGDLEGKLCPFQAHIRRANPRTLDKPIVPRILRRGMSYGPRYDAAPDAERGLMFMAYNASIAEQFEVIQRWLAGGNSSRGLSTQSDPFCGVPQPGDPRTFLFEYNGTPHRIALDTGGRPLVRLEWGVYLFVPSIAALKILAAKSAAATPPPVPWSAEKGELIIQTLLRMESQGTPGLAERWKALLEDISARASNTTASVWAAIRQFHHGVLRTPYGVLVGSKQLVMDIFEDPGGNYSVSGYQDRMRQSFGEIYLGLDRGKAYDDQSTRANGALMAFGERQAFDDARSATEKLLKRYIADVKALTQKIPDAATWELTLDMKEVSDGVLAALCKGWVGVPDPKGLVEPGGWSWDWAGHQPPRCPGHFTAPSRYTFQPRPGAAATHYGQTHGQALLSAFVKLVPDLRALPEPAPLVAALLKTFGNSPADDTPLASSFIGMLMGFLPTVDGNLRACLYEWINDRSLWDLQRALIEHDSKVTDPYARANAVLRTALCRTMQLRPVPELVWRTPTQPHMLGSVEVDPSDRVVVGIVSATQEDLAAGRSDVFPIFGGNRRTAPGHTHACPAYDVGMGVLLGIVTALLESGPLRPTPAPLTLSWSGPLP